MVESSQGCVKNQFIQKANINRFEKDKTINQQYLFISLREEQKTLVKEPRSPKILMPFLLSLVCTSQNKRLTYYR